MTFSKRQNYMTKNRSMVPGVGWGGGCDYKGGAWGRFWGDGTALCPDDAVDYTNLYMC